LGGANAALFYFGRGGALMKSKRAASPSLHRDVLIFVVELMFGILLMSLPGW
jgi:hypothetical protein